MNKPEIPPPKPDSGTEFNAATHRVQFNVEEWLPYFDDMDLTLEQKVEFIETLRNIITAFVELGLGMNSLQLACGEDFNLPAFLQAVMLHSENTENNKVKEENMP
ncbi:MAG: hypothetical protein GY761_16420 [Hyphomicrobiales bacterium]|nr:hypothetical protein [Hyphomicrobiales bacterium]